MSEYTSNRVRIYIYIYIYIYTSHQNNYRYDIYAIFIRYRMYNIVYLVHKDTLALLNRDKRTKTKGYKLIPLHLDPQQ